MAQKDSASLFSGRANNYIKYRPGYPPALLDLLASRCGLTSESIVADIGSGTGILTEMFLKHGSTVYAVEPNDEMRGGAEKLLGHYPNFTSIGATAESTALDSHSVDIVTAGQAFHWFKHAAARAEFVRILKPCGWAILIWNMARKDTPFLKEYDLFWQDDLRDAHDAMRNKLLVDKFFECTPYEKAVLEGARYDMNLEELTGRILSISAAIQPGEPGHAAFLEKIRGMFERHQRNQLVTMTYDTEVFFGQL
jgi:SAM-dependent methyltransferase